MRYALTIAYDGANFHGWQEQRANPNRDNHEQKVPCLAGDAQRPAIDPPPLRTVQGALRDTLQQVLQQPIQLIGASRTDTGVHALGQVAHFDAVDVRIPLDRMKLAINSRLPDDIDIRAVQQVADDFDAIRNAKEKQYRYRIWNASQRPLMVRSQVYHCWYKLDVALMNDAAGRLIGAHDFAGFANADHDRQTTVRTIYDCRVERITHANGDRVANEPTGQTDALYPPSEVHITVRGSGFLYNMVRIIAGTLIEVGRGAMQPQHIDEILRSADRQQAGPTAPPQGLILEWIRHDGIPQATT